MNKYNSPQISAADVYGVFKLCSQWVATPVNDMFADCVLTAVLQAESLDPASKFLPVPSKMDRMHFKVNSVSCNPLP